MQTLAYILHLGLNFAVPSWPRTAPLGLYEMSLMVVGLRCHSVARGGLQQAVIFLKVPRDKFLVGVGRRVPQEWFELEDPVNLNLLHCAPRLSERAGLVSCPRASREVIALPSLHID